MWAVAAYTEQGCNQNALFGGAIKLEGPVPRHVTFSEMHVKIQMPLIKLISKITPLKQT